MSIVIIVALLWSVMGLFDLRRLAPEGRSSNAQQHPNRGKSRQES